MLRNYLKIAWRSFHRDKFFTSINLISLASGLAIALFIVQYVRFELSYEKSYEKSDRLVRITTDILNGDAVVSQDCETYPPMAALLKDQLPEVTNSMRFYQIGEPFFDLKIDQSEYRIEKVYATDPSFFDMFDQDFIAGQKEDIFSAAREVVLTKSMAQKYFNAVDVVGKTIEAVGPNGNVPLVIKAVVEDNPLNTHLKFNMLLSYATLLADMGETEDNWNGNNTLTYLELEKNANYEGFLTGLEGFNASLHKQGLAKKERFIAQPVTDIHLYSHKGFETEPNGDATSVYLLLGVAFMVIISALVNYVNLVTSKSLDRAKEIGLRKVVGSTGRQIRQQVFLESLLTNLISAALALLLVFLLKDIFIHTAGLPEHFNLFSGSFFWFSLVGFLCLSVFISGTYPSVVLSSFKPVTVLKGNFSRSTKGALLRKGLVVFQFSVTIILLIQAFVVNRQLSFLRNADLGLKTDHILVVKGPTGEANKDRSAMFRQSLLKHPKVESVAISGSVPGDDVSTLSTTTGILLANTDDQEKGHFNYYINRIDESYFDLMDIKLLAGENYKPTSPVAFESGDQYEVIVNEKALDLWQIPSPNEAVGQYVRFWGNKWLIKGVVKDYNQFSPKTPQVPMVHLFSKSLQDSDISVKFSSGNAADQLALIKTEFERFFPYKPFDYFFLDKKYDQQFKAEERFEKVFGAITVFAILIACLGLLGLATFTVAKRTKEIGIRKSIGASTANVLVLLSSDFLKTATLSLFIGIPIAFFLIKSWLTNFSSHIEITWWLFALPALLVLFLVLISISGKTISTALMNPVKSLRSE
ncbi:ABC transporter permease [Marinilongibacter aquaticus]|uniref:ABC transporter permease n=1 Tax=Marinilongibacter aquaticus TaxID=2975157 RepID=UPI0021BD02CC|nr:ABC transporter permease [Marinilongibacter aquaticus]UBM57293.1 ABC transporter permease [Marinilongibacter aquaticus]